MRPKLIFSDSNENVIKQLRQAFEGCPELTALMLKPDELPKLDGLDALFLTLIAAERWGPRLIFYKSQVLKTRPEDRAMPPYIVTGIAMNVDDPRTRDPSSELKLVITAVLDAVESYNSENGDPIKTVGLWTNMLSVDSVDPIEAGQIIRLIYEDKGRATA
jgi:hypothetical protein